MREKLIHELEDERHQRLDSEKRLRGVSEESDPSRSQMVSIQQPFSRMEETVRSLLQNQGALDPAVVDTVDIMKAYKEKLSEELQKRQDSHDEHSSLLANQTEAEAGPQLRGDVDGRQSEQDKDQTQLLERLNALEEKNSALALENETQREQYERCLDEVANQVVQALLTQKDLQEECVKLRTRVFDLEQQNRTLSLLFQQQLKPTSDLLLQKLHSRILDLSAAELLPEAERGRGGGGFLLSRNAETPAHEVHFTGKAGLPATKCLSQLSWTVPPATCPRSSCSSSELSLSSACSEYSSGSFSWNHPPSLGRMSSLTWDKRLSLGSSAPSNICGPPEEQLPTRRKESHILEGLRKLQRRKHRGSSSSAKISKKSGFKDCMNSNEGIYSLGIKGGSKGVSKPAYAGRAAVLGPGAKKFSYDSDDADDELAHRSRGDGGRGKDGWLYRGKMSRSISDSLCSWEGLQDVGVAGGAGGSTRDGRPTTGYDSKERPEKLTSFVADFLPGRGRTSAFTSTALLRCNPPNPDNISDTDDPEDLFSESSDVRTCLSCSTEQVELDSRRLSRDAVKLLARPCLRRDHGRTRSADGRPRPFSLIKEPNVYKCTQSEESILAIFDAEGEPIELCGQRLSVGAGPRKDRPVNVAITEYTDVSPQERPTRQKAGNGRSYTVLQSPEKPAACRSKATDTSNDREGSAERLSSHVVPQRKLIKPLGMQGNKGQSVPPAAEPSGTKSSRSRMLGQCKPSISIPPIRVSKGSSTEPSNSGKSGPPGEEKSPLSPSVKISRYIKASGVSCTQSPNSVNPKLPSRSEWSKGLSSGSPRLSRRQRGHVDQGEMPMRDKHCETSKGQLRSPSPPPPPGRTASLLVRPNYEGSPHAHKTQPSAPLTVRGPPPSYHPPPTPHMQPTTPPKGRDSLELDAGYGTALAPQKLVDKSGQHVQSPPPTHTPTKGTSRRLTVKNYLPSATSGCSPDHEAAPKSSKNVPPPYSAIRGLSFQGTFVKRGLLADDVTQPMQKTPPSTLACLPDQPQYTTEQQDGKIASPQAIFGQPCSILSAPNQTEKACKTRIPTGFKAFLKSPPGHKNGASMPGKHEKDHINSVSKETVASSAPVICASVQSSNTVDPSAERQREANVRLRELERRGTAVPEDVEGRGSQLFLRSISISAKPHLKPALGMNGAKARSQSFSANYAEKPNVSAQDGPGKTRTHIITNSGERGNSLSRQSSLEAPNDVVAESPVRSPGNRVSYYGGMMEINSHSVVPAQPSKPNVEANAPQARREAGSLPITERAGLRNARRPSKVASHPQFQPPSSCLRASETANSQTSAAELGGPRGSDPSRGAVIQAESPNKPTGEEKKAGPSSRSIEEKVMMGIEENLYKSQEQEKVTTSETKQKTAPSLANWFGLRKSKLPALSGKKADSPKAKEEKKELKVGSVLGGKQVKSDKKKEKKRNDKGTPEGQNPPHGSIVDQCDVQRVPSQGGSAYIELLSRSGAIAAPLDTPQDVSEAKDHGDVTEDRQICSDTATLVLSEKMNLERDDGRMAENACQDHVIGALFVPRPFHCT